MELEHIHIEGALKTKIQDSKCCTMHGSLLFHKILEEKDQKWK